MQHKIVPKIIQEAAEHFNTQCFCGEHKKPRCEET
jgi:hypothetical protein